MENENKKTNFDMSKLSLKELVTVYENIADFLAYLKDKKIEEKEKK